MSAKRALVVDDSRSARVILGRMLETHGLHVDTAESGEQALEYLRAAQPDIVFMDHLMPGMDGFDALKAIKADPRTELIPVMMYTSQEGESYLRQARELGAAGVLPKTLMPIDVARALYQLRLLPERRDMNSRANQPAPAPPPPAATSNRPSSSAQAGDEMSAATRERFAELQRSLEANLEHAARRVSNEVRSAMHVAPQPPSAPTARAATPRGLIAALLVFALVPTLVSGALLWHVFATGKAQLDQANARLGMVVAEQQMQIELLRAELRRQAAGGTDDPASTRTDLIAVPYGEPPFAGSRIEHIHKLFGRLQAEGFKGKIRVEFFTSDFCLTRNGASYVPAAADLQLQRCDLIGNPFDDGLTAAQRQSSEYGTLIASLSQSTRGAVQVTTVHGGRKPLIAYPPQSDTLTAGEWNAAAARNQRVEVTPEPAADANTIKHE